MSKKTVKTEKHEMVGDDGWQYEVHYYKENGKVRKHRKKVKDLCACGNVKRTNSSMCRDCYQRTKDRDGRRAIRLLHEIYWHGRVNQAHWLEIRRLVGKGEDE